MRTSTNNANNTSTISLPPEFEKALKVINRKLEILHTKPQQTQKLSTNMWSKSGNLTIIKKRPKIRDIPSGFGWRWNQAKRRYNVTNDKVGAKIELLKLVPRKCVRSPISTLPTLKLWQASVVYKVGGKSSITVFWCEKGDKAAEKAVSNPFEMIEEQHPNPINLDDYSFLAPLMDPTEACQLWPSMYFPSEYQDTSKLNFELSTEPQNDESFMNFLLSQPLC